MKAILPLFLTLAATWMPATAFAGIRVHVDLEVGGGRPVSIDRPFSAEFDEDAATAVLFYDDFGNRCEVLLDADPAGAQTFIVLQVRCFDERRRQTFRSDPSLLVRNGHLATISIGGDDNPTSFRARILVVPDPSSDDPVAIRRSFFADPDLDRLLVYRYQPPWTNALCEGEFVMVPPMPRPRMKAGGEGDNGMEAQGFVVSGKHRSGEVVQTTCSADTPAGPIAVPFIVSFF